MIGFLLKNPYIAIAVVVGLLAIGGGIYLKGYFDGKEAVENKNVTVAIDLKGKQDEVRSRRPDVPAVAVSLQQHRF